MTERNSTGDGITNPWRKPPSCFPPYRGARLGWSGKERTMRGLLWLVFLTFGVAVAQGAPVAYEDGLRLFRNGDHAGAVTAMTRALDAQDDLSKARYVRATALMKLGKFLEAAADFDSLLAEGRPTAKLLVRRGLAWFKAERYEAALADALRALELEPGHDSARKLRDRSRDALEKRKPTAELKGPDPKAAPPDAKGPTPKEDPVQEAFEEGQLLYRKGKTEAAQTCFTRAISLDPTFAPAYHNRALCHIKLDKRDEAIKDFDALIQIDAGNARAHFDRAETLKAMGRFAEAAESFGRCLAIDEKNVKALFLRGNCWFNLKKSEEARKDWTRVCELDPDHLHAHNNLAVVLGSLGKTKEAEAVWAQIDALKKKGKKN